MKITDLSKGVVVEESYDNASKVLNEIEGFINELSELEEENIVKIQQLSAKLYNIQRDWR